MPERTMVPGPRLRGFREGWALKDTEPGKAHYFRRKGAGLAVSLCGSQDAAAGWLLEPGDFDQCARCAMLLAREAAQSAAEPPEASQDERNEHRE